MYSLFPGRRNRKRISRKGQVLRSKPYNSQYNPVITESMIKQAKRILESVGELEPPAPCPPCPEEEECPECPECPVVPSEALCKTYFFNLPLTPFQVASAPAGIQSGYYFIYIPYDIQDGISANFLHNLNFPDQLTPPISAGIYQYHRLNTDPQATWTPLAEPQPIPYDQDNLANTDISISLFSHHYQSVSGNVEGHCQCRGFFQLIRRNDPTIYQDSTDAFYDSWVQEIHVNLVTIHQKQFTPDPSSYSSIFTSFYFQPNENLYPYPQEVLLSSDTEFIPFSSERPFIFMAYVAYGNVPQNFSPNSFSLVNINLNQSRIPLNF